MENKNIFAEFLQTSGIYDSIAIGEENIFDLIEILKGNVKISVYCKECEHERVFTMKPIKYYFMTGPYDDEEINYGLLGDEVSSLQNMFLRSKDANEKNIDEWKWINQKIADTTRLIKV